MDIAKLIENCDGFAAVENGHVRGSIGGLYYHNPWNVEVLMLGEMWWYVQKKYRGGTLAGRLLHRFLEMGEGCSIIMATLNSTPEGVGRHLANRGFLEKERSWVRWKNAGV